MEQDVEGEENAYCRAVESSVLKQTTCCTLKPAAPSLSARMCPSYASSVRNTTAA